MHDGFLGGQSAGDFCGEPAFAQDNDAIGDREQLGQLARGHDDGPAFGCEAADQLVDFCLGPDVDSASRLIEQKHFGLDQEPSGEDAFLLVASGECGHRNVAACGLDRQFLHGVRHGAFSARGLTSGPMVSSGRRPRVMFSATVMPSKRPRVLRSSVVMAIPALIAWSGCVK